MASFSYSKPNAFAGMSLHMPAIIAFIGYVIMALVILLPFEYPVYDEVNDKTYVVKYDFGQRLVTLLLLTIPIILSVYTINCLIAGKCLTWSYIISIMTVFWVLMFVVGAFVYTFSKKK